MINFRILQNKEGLRQMTAQAGVYRRAKSHFKFLVAH